MSSTSQLRTYLLVVLLVSASAFSQQTEQRFVSRTDAGFQYTTLQVPGSSSTVASGINSNGDIVGSFVSGGVQSGFLYTGGNFQTLACPGGGTVAQGINDKGIIVGWCNGGETAQGFIYQNGKYTYATYPGSYLTAFLGINNQNEIVGVYQPSPGRQNSFIYSNGTFTAIKAQVLSGINNQNVIAGIDCNIPTIYQEPCQGALYVEQGGKWVASQIVNYPGAKTSSLNGINDNGDLAGYWGPYGQEEGFVYIKSTNTFVEFDIQGSGIMGAQGINNSGEIVGSYYDGATTYGFYGQLSQ